MIMHVRKTGDDVLAPQFEHLRPARNADLLSGADIRDAGAFDDDYRIFNWWPARTVK
jgi:hypothetical protein